MAERRHPIPHNTHSKQTKVVLILCQNYRTLSHQSKVTLRVLLNRINGGEWGNGGMLAEEQAGFRPKRGTVEHIFNLRLHIEKHLQ